MGYKIKTILFLCLLVLYVSIFIYSGTEMNIYYLILILFFTLSPVYYFMSKGAGRMELNYLSTEKRELINNCDDQYFEQFLEIVQSHFNTKQKLEQVQLPV